MCEGCVGAFRCWNSTSPCFGMFCREYPGTGPDPEAVRKFEEFLEKQRKEEK